MKKKCIKFMFTVKALVYEDAYVDIIPSADGDRLVVYINGDFFDLGIKLYKDDFKKKPGYPPVISGGENIFIDYDYFVSRSETDLSKMYSIKDEKKMLKQLRL